jgi:hypothetical protein
MATSSELVFSAISVHTFFLAHLAKGNVSLCHHLASSSVNFSHFNLREEEFLEINQSETRIACGGHVC